ncbi:PTS transporter subunit EIIB, partial [Vibrio fluvialis]|nr:PTS transporter subunit EIIB [Vibrio fluvialis]
MDYPVIAKQLLEHLGGKANIQALAHCATRLRLAVKDESQIDESAIETLD